MSSGLAYNATGDDIRCFCPPRGVVLFDMFHAWSAFYCYFFDFLESFSHICHVLNETSN